MENVTTPANKHVPVLTKQVITASLERKGLLYVCVYMYQKMNALLNTIMVEFVIRTQCWQGTSSNGIGKEYLENEKEIAELGNFKEIVLLHFYLSC